MCMQIIWIYKVDLKPMLFEINYGNYYNVNPITKSFNQKSNLCIISYFNNGFYKLILSLILIWYK